MFQDVDNIVQVFLRNLNEMWYVALILMKYSLYANEVHSVNELVDEFHVWTKTKNL
jgi:hypothetical protein